MAEPVSPPYTLPPEVLALLGDDVGKEGLGGPDAWLTALTEYRALRNWRKP